MGIRERLRRVFYGWWIVLAGAITTGFGGGAFFYGFTNFFKPMVKEFGWSYTATSGAFSLSRLESGLEGPLVGWLVDRFGPRKLMLIGLILMGLGFIAISRISSLWMFYLFFLGLSVGNTVGMFHAPRAAVANWFITKRSRALSFLSVGFGIGGTVVVPLLAWLILSLGWRSAAIVVGLVILIALLPLTFIVRHRPEDSGLLPDGVTMAKELEQGVVEAEVNFTAKQALKTFAFWGISVANTLRSFVIGGVVIHMVPHLINIGLDPQRAANVLAFLTLGSIPGRLIIGWLGDTFDKRYLMAICSVFLSITLFIFSRVNSIGLLYLTLFLHGIPYGGVAPLYPAWQADLFGRRYFATIGGISGLITMVGGVAGPVFAGYIYDTTQSYQMVFNVFSAVFLLSAIGFPFIKPPKPLPQATPYPTSPQS